MNTSSVSIATITVPPGRRPLRDIEQLASSIAALGLLQPITVTRENRLVLGYHRLEACRSLGWTEIPAHIRDGDPLNLELAEIDENLIRNDLNVVERGEHFVRREAILDARGLRAQSGTNLKNLRTGATVAPVEKTTPQLAAEMGMSERTLRNHKQIATAIAEPVRDVPTQGLGSREAGVQHVRVYHAIVSTHVANCV